MNFKTPYRLNERLTKLSKILAGIFVSMIAGDLIAESVFWIFADLKSQTIFSIPRTVIGVGASFPDVQILGDVTSLMRLLGWLASFISTSIWIYIYYHMSKLFLSFSKGYIFTFPNVACIRKSSKALIVYAFAILLTNSFLSLVLTMNNPEGLRTLTVSFGTPNLTNILIALVIMVCAYIMEEGLRLEEERQLTI